MSTAAALNSNSHLVSDTYAHQIRERGRSLEDAPPTTPTKVDSTDELRDAFDSFVGQTFYGMLLKSMRQSLSKSPYFHGGRGEEVFQQQLDQHLVERMSDASAESFTQPMFELFTMRRV